MALSAWIMLFSVEMVILRAMHREGCIEVFADVYFVRHCPMYRYKCSGVNNCIIQMELRSEVVSKK